MLEQEISFFEERLPELLKKYEGQFALVKDGKLDVFKTEQEAIDKGFEKYGAEGGFLVRQILREQPESNFPAFSLGLIRARF